MSERVNKRHTPDVHGVRDVSDVPPVSSAAVPAMSTQTIKIQIIYLL